jgi:hypothetical protein
VKESIKTVCPTQTNSKQQKERELLPSPEQTNVSTQQNRRSSSLVQLTKKKKLISFSRNGGRQTTLNVYSNALPPPPPPASQQPHADEMFRNLLRFLCPFVATRHYHFHMRPSPGMELSVIFN